MGTSAVAGVCEWRPSELVRSDSVVEQIAGHTAGAGTAAAVSAATAGVALEAAGFYIIPNFTTGAAMIGSTAAGSSAAGTAGIIAGTSGALGTAASIAVAPATAVVAAASAIGLAGLEGGCYFTDERVTDFPTVFSLVQKWVASGDPKDIGVTYGSDGPWLWLHNSADDTNTAYEISGIYIVNGEVFSRDWGLNTFLGKLDVTFGG